MYKHFTLIILALVALTVPFMVYAAIYKHVDANGNVTYSNVKISGAKKLAIEPADTNFGTNTEIPSENRPASNKSTANDFPTVDKTQKQRDSSRKEILLSELQSEKMALEQAKIAYKEGKANPEVYRKKNADGSSNAFRNVPKFQAKMKRLQEAVDNHQRNIGFLEKEFANIQ